MMKTIKLKIPTKVLVKNIFILEIGWDRRNSIVPFSISPAKKELPKETKSPISNIGHKRLKCLPATNPSKVVKDFGSRPKALLRPGGKFFIKVET